MFKIARYSLIAILLLLCVARLFSHFYYSQQTEYVRIAFAPWPGAAPLYLAKHLGYFKEEGVEVELVEFDTLVDVYNHFIDGNVVGFTGTIGEIIDYKADTNKIAQVVLVTDYSNGADEIIARDYFYSFTELIGQKIGVEQSRWALLLLDQALEANDMGLEDVEVVHAEQPYILSMLEREKIAAAVVYPPYSTEIYKKTPVNKIFDTSRVPFTFMGIVGFDKKFIDENPKSIRAVIRGWEKALSFMSKYPVDAATIMAKSQGMTLNDFIASIEGLHLLSYKEQLTVVSQGKLSDVFNKFINIIPSKDSDNFNITPAAHISFRKDYIE